MDAPIDADVARRARSPAVRFFEALGCEVPDRRAAEFFQWLEEWNVPARSGLSLRQLMKVRLTQFAESSLRMLLVDMTAAADAFDEEWWTGVRDRAVERARSRFLSARRIVPFLVYQRAAEPAAVAAQMGLKEADVRAYLEEVRTQVRAEARLELETDGEPLEGMERWLESGSI